MTDVRYPFNTSGLTLVELIIASVLVTIVMIGAVSIDYAVRRQSRTAATDARVSLQANGLILRLSRSALAAVGDSTSPGVVNAADFICFRQATGSDPNVYTDDSWSCFDVNAGQLRQCTRTAGDGTGPCTGFNPISLGPVVDFTHAFTFDAPTRVLAVDLGVRVRADPGAPAHPINNPEVQQTTRVVPPGHGF